MDPIDVYIHEASTATAYCSNSVTGKCPALPISQTNGFMMLSQNGTKTLLNYIDTLKCILDGACGAETKWSGSTEFIRVVQPSGKVGSWKKVQDVKEAHRQLKKTFSSLQKQKADAQLR